MAPTAQRTIDRAPDALLNVEVGHENGVYYVRASNIPGLNVEAETFEGFVEIAKDLAPDLLEISAAALPDIHFTMTSANRA